MEIDIGNEGDGVFGDFGNDVGGVYSYVMGEDFCWMMLVFGFVFRLFVVGLLIGI